MKQNLYTPEMIDYSLGPPPAIPECARVPLSDSLALLPRKVIDFITENYTFISLDEDTTGQHWILGEVYCGNEIGFILLNSNLWKKKPIQIAFTIAHEVAHAFKRHRNAASFRKFIKQEKEADGSAVRWLSKHYKKEDLLKLCRSKIHEKKCKSFLMKKVGCG